MSGYGSTEDEWQTLIEEEAMIAGAAMIVKADADKLRPDSMKGQIDRFLDSDHGLKESYAMLRMHVNRALNPSQSDVEEVGVSLQFIDDEKESNVFLAALASWPVCSDLTKAARGILASKVADSSSMEKLKEVWPAWETLSTTAASLTLDRLQQWNDDAKRIMDPAIAILKTASPGEPFTNTHTHTHTHTHTQRCDLTR